LAPTGYLHALDGTIHFLTRMRENDVQALKKRHPLRLAPINDPLNGVLTGGGITKQSSLMTIIVIVKIQYDSDADTGRGQTLGPLGEQEDNLIICNC
jgi:hypothetical protein